MASARSNPAARPSTTLLTAAAALLAACTGVAPDPASASIDELPEVAVSAEQRAEVDRLQAEAVDAVVRRRYDDAEQLAQQALAVDPRAARARAVLAMVMLQRAAREQPVAWPQLRRGEYELALARLLAPEDAFVGWMHAVFLAEAGHMSAAAAAAEAALQRTADAPASERAALLGTAGTYRYELGEERAALPHLQAYVGLRPDDAAAHFRLGASLLAISKTPQAVVGAYDVAQVRAEGAVRAFARSYELAPGDEDAALAVATAHLRAAELAEQRGEDGERDAHRDAAVEHLRAVGAAFPDSAEVQFRLGVVGALMGELPIARAAYVAALERDGDHVGSLLNLARLLADERDRAAAEGLLRRLLASPRASREMSSDERRRIEQWLAAPAGTAGESASSGDR